MGVIAINIINIRYNDFTGSYYIVAKQISVTKKTMSNSAVYRQSQCIKITPYPNYWNLREM